MGEKETECDGADMIGRNIKYIYKPYFRISSLKKLSLPVDASNATEKDGNFLHFSINQGHPNSLFCSLNCYLTTIVPETVRVNNIYFTTDKPSSKGKQGSKPGISSTTWRTNLKGQMTNLISRTIKKVQIQEANARNAGQQVEGKKFRGSQADSLGLGQSGEI